MAKNSSEIGTLILLRDELRELMTIPDYIEAVEDAFREYGLGNTFGIDMLHGDCPSGLQFHMKVGGLKIENESYYGLKMNASSFTNMEKYHLPNIMGAILLFNAENGYPLAILDSIEPTIKRTGAGTAVALKYLARKESTILTICGCGKQGEIQLLSALEILPLKKVYAFDIAYARSQEYAERMEKLTNLEIIPVKDLESAIKESDVVITCTPSTQPYIAKEWLHPGLTLAAIGADSPNKQELDADCLKNAKLYVDIKKQCAVAGELHHALSAKDVSESDVFAEIGEVVAEKKAGRQNSEEIILYDATGTALQDTAAAAICYLKALEHKMGKKINLIQ